MISCVACLLDAWRTTTDRVSAGFGFGSSTWRVTSPSSNVGAQLICLRATWWRTRPPWEETPADCAWYKLLRNIEAEAVIPAGIRASDDGRIDHAKEAFLYAEQRGNAEGRHLLGLLLEDRDELAEAEVVWRRGDAQGDVESGARLGDLMRRRGDLKSAEEARRADQLGHEAAAVSLGKLFRWNAVTSMVLRQPGAVRTIAEALDGKKPGGAASRRAARPGRLGSCVAPRGSARGC